MEWKQNNKGEFCAEFEKDVFTLVCRFVVDEMPDYSYLGTFTNEPGESTIKHSRNTGEYRYFNPAIPECAQEDYKRMLQVLNGEWYQGGIIVSAVKRLPNLKYNGGIGSKGGYEKIRGDVTLAECALWGIESDSGEDYFTSTALELAQEAIEEAKQTLKDLCS